MSLSLWHDAASLNEAGRAVMALPVCIVTGAALRSLSSVALSSAPTQIFYHAGAIASKVSRLGRGTRPNTHPKHFWGSINGLKYGSKNLSDYSIMEYRRAKAPGGTFFFTVVTHNRRKFLCVPENIVLLRQAFRYGMTHHPFKIEAIVILPDHLHCLWSLPRGDEDFSTRWRLIKSYFSHHCAPIYHGHISASREHKQEQAVWQRRFWEHQIRDETDFIRHVEYIHYNPVKHGLVKAPRDWAYSSFRRYVRAGKYPADWGAGQVISFPPEVGQE